MHTIEHREPGYTVEFHRDTRTLKLSDAEYWRYMNYRRRFTGLNVRYPGESEITFEGIDNNS